MYNYCSSRLTNFCVRGLNYQSRIVKNTETLPLIIINNGTKIPLVRINYPAKMECN